jgi:group I intron endonuclease
MLTIGNFEGSGIYKISIKNNLRIYIGSSSNLKVRKRNHICALKGNYHHAKNLQNAWNKSKPEDFTFEILEYCTEDKLEEREQYYLDTLIKASENNSDFYKLSLNSGRSSKRNSSKCEKVILQYSIKGIFLKEWRSAKLASIELNLPYTSIIQCALKNKAHRHSGNFIWRKWQEEYPLIIEEYNYKHFLQKKIKVTFLETGEIKIFDGKRLASRELNIPRTTINYCIKRNQIHIKKQLKIEEICPV